MKQFIKPLHAHNYKQFVRYSLMLIAICIIIPFALTGCTANTSTAVSPPNSNIIGNNPTIVSPLYDENTVVSLYDRAIPALVEINTTIGNKNTSVGPFQFNIPGQSGLGSGFFIDKEGHILTNNHVIDNANSVKVILHNGNRIDAKVVGRDRQNDLALSEVDTTKLDNTAYLQLGNSDTIKPGQMAIAMGSPFGLDGSVTIGIISGVGRSLPSDARRPIANVIQTDAAINPGNSGGPLLNSKGEVIGINTAIEASGSGIGFAIPINTAKTLLPALLKGGEIKNAWLGIEGTNINQEVETKLGLPVKSGVYIIGVVKGGPAEKAGLVASGRNKQNEPELGGDIIVAVDDVSVAKVENLVNYFNGKRPGDKVSITIYRGNNKQTLLVELGEWPAQTPVAQSTPQTPPNFNFGRFSGTGNFHRNNHII